MKKKLWLMITVLVLLISFSATAFAASFPDIQDESWSWARSIIDEMSEKGYVTGYTDGTFGPSLSVTKLQSLILVARILGVNDETNESYVELAQEVYEDELQLYSISNKKEVSYLLYKHIISTSELDKYISAINANTSLKRHEAAILLTKAMGKENTVKNKLFTVLPYEDAAAIPSQSKSYVEYVKDQDIMTGMTETEFGPMADVTRAQMTVMLYRVLKKNEEVEKKSAGVIIYKDIYSNTLRIKDIIDVERSYEIAGSTIIKLDGDTVQFSDFPVGADVILTWRADQLYMLEGLSPNIDESVEGIITDITGTGSSRKIKIKIDKDGTTTNKEYLTDTDVQVTYNGKTSTISAIDEDDYAKLSIGSGKIKKLEAESKTKEVEGIVEELISEPLLKIKVELDDSTVKEYEVLDNVTVRKNNKSSELKNIQAGDEVELTLEYYKVKKIDAASTRSTSSGIIEEIIISKTPSLTIKNGSTTETYSLMRDADIEIDDKDGLIYDLRLGYSVEFALEGSTITSLETKALSQTTQITGRVELVNESYGLINVNVIDTATGESTIQQIFIAKGAKIIRSSDTRKIDLDDIDEDDIITAIGTTTSGVFEANTIIVINN